MTRSGGKLKLALLKFIADLVAEGKTDVDLDILFKDLGAPGEPPAGDKAARSFKWLQLASKDDSVDFLGLLGGLIRPLMESVPMRVPEPTKAKRGTNKAASRWDSTLAMMVVAQDLPRVIRKNTLETLLKESGLEYRAGGSVAVIGATTTTSALELVLHNHNLPALDVEFKRATENAQKDPAVAMPAASSILEAFCRVYIEDEKLALPSDKSLGPLWQTVRTHVLSAAASDEDTKKIFRGLGAIVDGIGSLRTHQGSAHGHGQQSHQLTTAEARLAVHASHALLVFLFDTWDSHRRTVPAGTTKL